MLKFILTIIVVAIIAIPFWLLWGLIWMLGLGVLADIFNAPNLAIGYWQSVLVGFIVAVLLGGLIGSSK